MNLDERIIHAWVELNNSIKDSLYLRNLSSNEMSVCHYLYREERLNKGYITSKEISEHTRMVKSQVNVVLKDLLDKHIVKKVQSQEDKRIYKIYFTDKGRQTYLTDHARILEIVTNIKDLLGEGKIESFIEDVYKISDEFRKIGE